MRDSLDLAALQAEAQAVRETNQRWRKALYGVYVLPVVGMLLVFLAVNVFPELILTAQVVTAVGVGSIILTIVISDVVAYRRGMQYARTVNAHAPAFVERITPFDVVRHSWLYHLTIVVLIAAALDADHAVLIGVVGFVPALIYVYGYRWLIRWVYAGGLKRAEQMLRLWPGNSHFLNIKAVYLLTAGEVREAESILRILLGRKYRRKINEIGLLLNNLGACLMIDQQYEEALPVLEAAVRIFPGLGNTYDSLAGWYLEQNLDAERAVELSDVAVAYTPPAAIDSMAVALATNARALALTGRTTRAEVSLKGALEAIPKLMPIPACEINRQAGYTRLALGDAAGAAEHFRRAVALDPKGAYGKLAQQALESLAT